MIKNGTRVKVNMAGDNNTAVIIVLNRIGGEVVKQLKDGNTIIGYLVAYDVKHLAEIEEAAKVDYKNEKYRLFFSILGNMRPKEFPNDKRYYLLAFKSELKPN